MLNPTVGREIGEDVSVGISDLLAYRDCPRRAAYGARRHTGEGTQDQAARNPEAGSHATAYGSAIHDAIAGLEDGLTDKEVIALAWGTWGSLLDAEDLALMHEDLLKFHERDFKNVRTVLVEGEIKVPLCMLDDGRRVWFRAKIDRLYERLDAPGQFIHVDYKSSKWRKDQDDVDADPQMWAYNWIVSEYFPECEDLNQWYDQLRHGMVPTSKTDEQRLEIRDWLEIEARAYFADDIPVMDDGLPKPRFNMWCPWCSILESCSIVPELTDWALTRIEALNPAQMRTAATDPAWEDGEPRTPIDTYIEQAELAKTAIKTLETYVKSVNGVLKAMPSSDRERAGYRLSERTYKTFSPQAMEALAERVGPQFLTLVNVTQKSLEGIKDEELREWALALADKVPGAPMVVKQRR